MFMCVKAGQTSEMAVQTYEWQVVFLRWSDFTYWRPTSNLQTQNSSMYA